MHGIVNTIGLITVHNCMHLLFPSLQLPLLLLDSVNSLVKVEHCQNTNTANLTPDTSISYKQLQRGIGTVVCVCTQGKQRTDHNTD